VRFNDGERSFGTDMARMLAVDPGRSALRKALDEVQRRMGNGDRLLNRDAAAFLASPGSSTPYHLDHEQNFLCHISGKKTLCVWDHADRSIVGEHALEVFYREGSLREVVCRPGLERKATVLDLAPGDAVYMPMGSPHAG